jgi:hypothetical protein
MQERGITTCQVRSWLRHQLIVRAFIDRRVRLFVRVSDAQVAGYYQEYQEAIREPLSEAVRGQILALLVEQQVNRRLDALVKDLHRKASLDYPP